MTLAFAIVDALQSVAWSALRLPLVQLRLLVATPAAVWPAIVGLLAMTVAWHLGRWRSRRAGTWLHGSAFLAGILTIGWFLRWSNIDWTQTNDWRKEWAYYSALQQGVATNTLPFLMPGSFQGTDRYLANLETVIAPHAVLLKVMSIPQFFLLHVLIAYSAGFAALVGLRQELRLGALPWVAFVALFLLNGHLTGHLSAGHTQWTGYFLIPWVYLCIVRVARGGAGAINAATLAIALSGMIWIGAWHVFVWSLIFSAVACAASVARVWFLLRVVGLVAGLSAVRLAPALLTFGTGINSHLGDFSGLGALFAGLVGDPGSVSGPLDWVEYNTFIGWIGLAALGVGFSQFRSPLWWPSLTLVTLAMGGLYRLTLFHLPGFVSERVSSRLAIAGVLALLLIGLAQVNRWLEEVPSRWRPRSLIVLALSWLAIVQLVLRAEQTRPRAAARAGLAILDGLKNAPVEPAYWWSFSMGAVVSAVSVGAIAIRCWRTRHGRPPAVQETSTTSGEQRNAS